MLDQLAKYERAKFTERSRRGKLQKARQGKIIATMKPPYGFRYNEARDALVIHEPERRVVERIFRLAAEGHGTKAIQTRLYREGIPSPTGKELWHRPVIKRMVLSDTYKPHTYEEAVELVPPTVAATLRNGEEYGIRWWNRSSQSRAKSPSTHRMELDGIVGRSLMRVGLRRSGLGRRCRPSFPVRLWRGQGPR